MEVEDASTRNGCGSEEWNRKLETPEMTDKRVTKLNTVAPKGACKKKRATRN